MDEKLDKALEIVLGMVRTNLKGPEALQITQAALNLAHTKDVLNQRKPTRTKGSSA
jgi:hypothetical protein